MDTAAKFIKMHKWLDTGIEQIIEFVDQVADGTLLPGQGLNPGMLAGFSTAKVLLAHAQYTAMGEERPDGWEQFRKRLQVVVKGLTEAPEAGQVTAFGVWDGLHATACEAGRLDDERVRTDGSSLSMPKPSDDRA